MQPPPEFWDALTLLLGQVPALVIAFCCAEIVGAWMMRDRGGE